MTLTRTGVALFLLLACFALPANASPERAALLVANPQMAGVPKTYIGTVTWTLTRDWNAVEKNSKPILHADIDLPEAEIKTRLDIEKNDDTSPSSASFFFTLNFAKEPDSPVPDVKRISSPQLRMESSPNGAVLLGAVQKIADGIFLFGLRGGDGESQAIALLAQREWIDIPILLANGRIAKLTFEEGASGRRALQAAFDAWGVAAQFTSLPPQQVLAPPASQGDTHYLKILFDRIARQRHDQRSQLDKAITAEIGFWLDNDGNITTVRIFHSSGDAAYDKASMGAVIAAEPFPKPPAASARGFLVKLTSPIKSQPSSVTLHAY